MQVFIVLAAVCAVACGSGIPLSPPGMNGKIVGGGPIDIDNVPYQLAMEYFGTHHCGATIISNYWALTAAHCVNKISPVLLTLRAGSSRRGEDGTVHDVQLIVRHPSFSSNGTSIDYDYAVMKVANPFKFGPGVQLIRLADVEPQAGAPAILSGWGSTVNGGLQTTELNSVQMPIVSREECLKRYGGQITANMICAGVLDVGGKGACWSDAGGPLESGGALVGMASWSLDCASDNYPGVFANVAAAREWIRNATGGV